jgi:bifunctional non-homologous end joining protein LigD
MKIKSGKYSIEITHGDKLLFEKSHITKQEIIEYYQMIAPHMLPYCQDRPISMQRFTHGIEHEGFFQKDASDYFPAWIKRIPVKKQTGGTVNYVVIDKSATIIYLANQDCITPHIWLSRCDKLDTPDRMIFDLDPPDEHSFTDVQHAAKNLKTILDALELPSFCMLTGSRGAHIIIPLKRKHSFEQVRKVAHDIAMLLAQQHPTTITIDVHKNKRGKKVFIDWLRNSFSATAVAPYAVRAHDGAPVATPVTWKELLSSGMHSQKYTIKNIAHRIHKVGNIWHDMEFHAVNLKKVDAKLTKGVI